MLLIDYFLEKRSILENSPEEIELIHISNQQYIEFHLTEWKKMLWCV